MKKNSLKCISLGIVTTCCLLRAAEPILINDSIIAQRESFESADVLKAWQAPGSHFQIDKSHAKDGDSSLLWRWNGPTTLVLDDKALPGLAKAAGVWPGGRPETYEPLYVAPSRQGGLKLWVYRETPSPEGTLDFYVGADAKTVLSNPKYRFSMRQNFTGWRTLWVHFEEDAKVAGYKGDDTMRAMAITPSANMPSDEVCLDMLQLLTYISKKRHSDGQFVNHKDKSRWDSYDKLPVWEALQQFQPKGETTTDETAGLAKIEDRLNFLILGRSNDTDAKSTNRQFLEKSYAGLIKSAKEAFAGLDIHRENGGLLGTPLFSARDEQPAVGGQTFQDVMVHVAYGLALGQCLSPSKENQDSAMLFFDYIHDQGWAALSALGSTDHLIRMNPVALATFMLRHELAASGRLPEQDAALQWYAQLGDVVDLNTSEGCDTDIIRGGALPKLISILLMENSPRKTQLMRRYVDYINHVSDFAPGYADTIKPDYSVFHHNGAYENVYGIQSLTVLCMVDWLLRDTAFALSPETTLRLKHTLEAQRKFAADFELHPGVCGRFPDMRDPLLRFLSPAYAFLAASDLTVTDPGMAASFADIYVHQDAKMATTNTTPILTYYGGFGTVDLMDAVNRQNNGAPYTKPAGYFYFPYAGNGVYHHDGWVASVRGMSQYVWDFETSDDYENTFGRYISFGALFLFTEGRPLSLDASGVKLNDGFQWSYMPGATTKALPMEELAYIVHPTERYVEGKHRNYTRNTFLGGVSLGENNGVFAMDFHDTVAPDEHRSVFDDSFTFKKSLFFFGNEIVALGSGISNDDYRYETITTLFQNQIDHGNLKNIRQETDGGCLSDAFGNYYIVPGDQKVVLEQDMQNSLKIVGQTAGTRAMASVQAYTRKAWISHGTHPENQSYEYTILVKGTQEDARRLSRQSDYTVLQRDQNAHIVRQDKQGVTGYALFTAGNVQVPGVLDYVSEPVVAMVREQPGTVTLSIADPDLKLAKWNHNMSNIPVQLKNAPAGESYVTVRLRGSWSIINAPKDLEAIYYYDGYTECNIRLDNGMDRKLQLVPLDRRDDVP